MSMLTLKQTENFLRNKLHFFIMLHKLILQNWRFNLCTDKQSFKYSQTLIIPIHVCAQANIFHACTNLIEI